MAKTWSWEYMKTLRKFKKYSNRSSLSWSSSTNGTNSCTSNVNEQKLIYQTCSLSMNPYLQVLRGLNNRCTKKNQSMPRHHLLDKSQRPKLPRHHFQKSLPHLEKKKAKKKKMSQHIWEEKTHWLVTSPYQHHIRQWQLIFLIITFLSVSSFFLPAFLILLFVVCIGN